MSRKARWVRPDALPRLVDYTFLAIVILLLFVGLAILTSRLQMQQCPPETFETGPMRDGLLGPVIAMIGIAVTFGYAVRHLIFHLLPSLRKWRKPGLSCAKKGHWNVASLWIAALLASGTWLWYETFSQFCLSDQAILHRNGPSRAFQMHEWSDVATVATACRRVYRRRTDGTDVTYALVMKDGTTIDIATSVERMRPIFPRVQQNLRGHPFRFDAHAVDPDCPSYMTRFLRTRP